MELSARGQRVLGCLVEKALATPNQYPLSHNALVAACNQKNGRDPVVAWDESDVREGLDELKAHQLVQTEYSRGSRVPKAAHRLQQQLDLDTAEQAVLALLLLRGPQTRGELRTRSERLHAFADLDAVEEVLGRLAAHRFGALVELQERQPGQKEARWAHLLGDAPSAGDDAEGGGLHLPFKRAVEAMDMVAAMDLLAPDVVFRSPAVHRPYEGREATGMILAAVAHVFEDFRYLDVLDAGRSVGLVFEARVGDRVVQGWDYLQFDDDGLIREFTVMIRPLSGLQALVARMGELLDASS